MGFSRLKEKRDIAGNWAGHQAGFSGIGTIFGV